MKKLLLLFLIMIFSLIAGNLNASPIPVKILTSNFSVSGSICGIVWNDEGEQAFSDNYAQSGAVPLNDGATYGWYYDGAGASSGTDYFSVSASAWGDGDSWGGASAAAELIFQPLLPMDKLTIDYNGGFPGAASHGSFMGGIYLTDIIDGTRIFSQMVNSSCNGSVCWERTVGSYLIDYSFQTDHVYKLYLSADASSDYDTLCLNISTNDIREVPEPATILLLGLGLIGLARVRID